MKTFPEKLGQAWVVLSIVQVKGFRRSSREERGCNVQQLCLSPCRESGVIKISMSILYFPTASLQCKDVCPASFSYGFLHKTGTNQNPPLKKLPGQKQALGIWLTRSPTNSLNSLCPPPASEAFDLVPVFARQAAMKGLPKAAKCCECLNPSWQAIVS